MAYIVDYPLMLLFPLSLAVMVAAAWGGGWIASHRGIAHEQREDFGLVQTASLTLLGLLIGFTFSMALSRYDQRKNFEEEEANAIGTAYLRAELLPAAAAAKLQAALRSYTELRVRAYVERNADVDPSLGQRMGALQTELWAIARTEAVANPSPVTQIVATGINDVINSQGYAQAAAWNRIPHAAWLLLGAVALISNLLVGLGARKPRDELHLLGVFPLIVAVSFLLIADIDAPRGGMIRVSPQNLHATLHSMR